MNKKLSFDTKGYWIEKNFFNKKEMSDLFLLFYNVSFSMAKRFKLINKKKFKSPDKVNFPRNMKDLDKLLMEIFKFKKDLIGEIYDTVSYSSTFLRFLSQKKLEKITRELLGLSKKTSLYGSTNRIRIDPPKDTRRTYGWHQEVFYTIPKSHFLQTWCPILRDTTTKNGTIEICEKSHIEKIAKQEWKDIPGRATQIIVDKKIVRKYKIKKLPMKLGDLMFFSGYLFHRSGNNSTKKEIRFSLVGMWHNINDINFRAPKPTFTYRGQSAKKYYISNLGKK